jgi:hypothetical protein
MIAYVCDCCKQKVFKETLIFFKGMSIGQSTKKKDKFVRFDLCKECYNKLNKIINGGLKL